MDNNLTTEEMEQEAVEAKKVMRKKVKYRIDYKKLGFLFGGLILIVGVVWSIFHFWGSGGGEEKVYDVAVQLRDQTNSDLNEDARSSAKKGDVIVLRETGREWSTTENASYLIIKMKLNEKQASKLTQPKTKKLSKDEGKKKGLIDDEILKNIDDENLEQILREDVLFREYRIEIEKMDFDVMKVREAQPFPDKEFDWGIVEKK